MRSTKTAATTTASTFGSAAIRTSRGYARSGATGPSTRSKRRTTERGLRLLRPGVEAGLAAELGALGSEDAPVALPTRDDPVVQHPDVRQLALGAADLGAR